MGASPGEVIGVVKVNGKPYGSVTVPPGAKPGKRLKMQVPHPPGSKVSFDYAGAYVPPGEGSRVSPAAPVRCAAQKCLLGSPAARLKLQSRLPSGWLHSTLDTRGAVALARSVSGEAASQNPTRKCTSSRARETHPTQRGAYSRVRDESKPPARPPFAPHPTTGCEERANDLACRLQSPDRNHAGARSVLTHPT